MNAAHFWMALLLFSAFGTRADGLVRRIEGDAMVSKDGRSWKKLRTGVKIHNGWGLKTAGNGVVDLELTRSGSMVRVSSDTVFWIDKEITNPGGSSETQLDLKKGRFLAVTGNVAGASRFEVKMPVGVVGLRADETQFDAADSGIINVVTGELLVVYVDVCTGLMKPPPKTKGGETVRPDPKGGCGGGIVEQIAPVALEKLKAEIGDLKKQIERSRKRAK